ncbi:MAG: hypothetical protein ACYCPO_06610 [Acidobacteriaceae bacterium]
MGIKSTHSRTTRISGEIRAAIIAADPSASHADLVRKYGISDVSVLGIRRKAGIVRVKSKPGPKPATSTVKKSHAVKKSRAVEVPAAVSRATATNATGKSKFHPRDRVSSSTAIAGAPTIVCSLEPSTLAVTLNFSPDQLDAIWYLFPIDVKVIAVTAALQAKVEAA